MKKDLLERHTFFEYDAFPPFGSIIRKVIPSSLRFISVKRRPLMLICETVNICDNDCIICAHNLMTRKKETMTLDTFKKILGDYSDMGGGKLSLTPMIGDIFLDKFLIDRIRMVRHYQRITGLSVTTNAISSDRFSNTELKFILDCFERFHISIYGLDDEEYQTMTRKPHFLRMIRNVRRIIELSKNKRNIVIGFRLLKDRSDFEIKSWIQQNFGCELPYSCTKIYANWGNKIDISKKLPFNGEWIQSGKNTSRCLVPYFACQVFSNGDVSFCACPDFDINDELKLGNVKNNSLIEIYNSEKCARLFDTEEKMPAFCQHCSFFKPVSDISQYEQAINNPIDFIGG